MRVRRIAELKRTQARMLSNFRAASVDVPDVAVAEAESPGSGVLGLARVASVVNADPDRGAHLVLARQISSGQPPAFADDTLSPQVSYPGPGHAVADYAVDEFVLCCRFDGVCVAIKIS